MARVSEIWAQYAFAGSPGATREVFEGLPSIMQEVVRIAAAQPDTWLSYQAADAKAGNRPGTFSRSFGGYHSRDPFRPRPFHIGQDEDDRFHLLVDRKQAAAIVG